jgi:hypothetical protein
MRLGLDQKDVPAQTGCSEVATDSDKAQFGVIGYLLGIHKRKSSEVKKRVRWPYVRCLTTKP